MVQLEKEACTPPKQNDEAVNEHNVDNLSHLPLELYLHSILHNYIHKLKAKVGAPLHYLNVLTASNVSMCSSSPKLALHQPLGLK